MAGDDAKTGKSADAGKTEPAVNRRDAFRGIAAAAAAATGTLAGAIPKEAEASEDMTWCREQRNP